MDFTTRLAARRRALAIVAATATAASGVALLGPSSSSASSHREAPYILNDPAVDNTDTYAFVSPNDAGKVTLIANWAPFSDPTGGPNFYPWDTSAAYDINIDNDGDAKPDIVYRWTFSDVDTRGVVDRGVGNGGEGTILYADGPVTSLTDENLRFRQTYDLVAIAEGGASVSLVNDGKVAPSNVGKATIPDYAALREAAITGTSDGGKSYVGQADDPFFIDLRVFDLLYGGDLSEVGDDTLAGYNVNTVALELPKELLVANKDAAANPVIGVWSTTSREKTRVFADTNAAPSTSTTDSSDETADSGNLVQVSRLGNPLVNEAVVPANLRDLFNRSTPDRDAQFLGKVQDPEVPALIELLYKIPNPNKLDSAPAKKRNDLVGSFLTGFSKDVFAGTTFGGLGAGVVDADLNSLDINAVSPSPAPAEYLRLNVNVPLTAEPNRLGVVGGDLAGFPNGRRLSDDIVDIELQVFEGVLIRPEGDLKTAVAGLGDAVNKNDRKFLNTFPFIADPHSGSDVECARANRPGNGNAKACGQAAAQGKKK